MGHWSFFRHSGFGLLVFKRVLPKQNRLKAKKDFERVFKQGRGVKAGFLFLKVVENNLGKSRFGFIVSQKVSRKAVVRNKVKRRLRAIIRKKINEIKKGLDMVIMANPEIEKQGFQEIEEDADKIFSKARILNPKP